MIARQIVLSLYSDLGRHGGVLKQYQKWQVVRIFGHCRQFPQHFGHVQAQIILYFIKIKRVCFIDAYIIPLVFFQDQNRQGRLVKLKKNISVVSHLRSFP